MVNISVQDGQMLPLLTTCVPVNTLFISVLKQRTCQYQNVSEIKQFHCNHLGLTYITQTSMTAAVFRMILPDYITAYVRYLHDISR